MSEDELESVVKSLEDRTEATDHSIRESSPETALVVTCSMRSCDHGETLWPTGPSWTLVEVPTLGNQAWDRHDGETVLDGTLAHLTTEYDVTAVVVVGHTACDVVEKAHDRQATPATGPPAAIEAALCPLGTLVDDAFETGVIEESTSVRAAHRRLVEYNVVRQVSFLTETLPESVTTVGYVHDQDGVYSSFPGKHHILSLDGETDPVEIDERLPDGTSARVGSPLS